LFPINGIQFLLSGFYFKLEQLVDKLT